MLPASKQDEGSSHLPTDPPSAPHLNASVQVTRGIDFKGVATVINFDMPGSTQG